eukprot:TRINITY_DN3593_c0_g1_i6.p2 TRINITY_DN3593_c0_g1~~TRINITY_DN3593_c0_g1_i6.p2  ORF type:complete len:114 (+),score=16.15 TRINITY_DN3593_c0_g1_i6:251-592(+)
MCTMSALCQLLDRKRAAGRPPSKVSAYEDLPAQYLALRKSGDVEWLHVSRLKSAAERDLIIRFEQRFPRSASKPCAPVKAYAPARMDSEGEWSSEDEVDLNQAKRLHARFGSR